MIASLRGKIADKQAGKVVVDVAGVGYEVAVPVETYSQLGEQGEEVSLHVHTHMREGAISLYGFHSPRDRGLFEKFIDVSGVGPRLALTLLSGMPTSELLAAIQGGGLQEAGAHPRSRQEDRRADCARTEGQATELRERDEDGVPTPVPARSKKMSSPF